MSGAQSGGEPRLPSPAELEGMEVRDKAGSSVGRVEDIYVAREGGATRYVALASETSGEVHPVPAGVVRVDESSGCLVADCSDEELRGGPTVVYEEGMTRPAEERVEAYWRDLHGAGYMRPENEPPEVHGAGRMDPKFLATVRRWRDR